MWCACSPCYNRADFKEKMRKKKEEKENEGSEKKYQPLKDYKIALLAMLLEEDFKTLKSQFLN
eukprot:5496093-Ditylum_brightwellii.AAC.1